MLLFFLIEAPKSEPLKKANGVDVTKILLFSQIPIVILLVVLGYFMWNYCIRRRQSSKDKMLQADESNTILTEAIAL